MRNARDGSYRPLPAGDNIDALVIAALFAALALWPGYTPLIAESRADPAALERFYCSRIAGFLPRLPALRHRLRHGCRREDAARCHRPHDRRAMAPYMVFALFAAHFIAMFNWSRLRVPSPPSTAPDCLHASAAYGLCCAAAGIAMTAPGCSSTCRSVPGAGAHYTPARRPARIGRRAGAQTPVLPPRKRTIMFLSPPIMGRYRFSMIAYRASIKRDRRAHD